VKIRITVDDLGCVSGIKIDDQSIDRADSSANNQGIPSPHEGFAAYEQERERSKYFDDFSRNLKAALEESNRQRDEVKVKLAKTLAALESLKRKTSQKRKRPAAAKRK
jgi:PAB1-binding protein PBP1